MSENLAAYPITKWNKIERKKSDVLIGEFVNAIVDIPHPSLQQCIGNDWVDASTPLESSAIREAWITRCLEIDSFMLGNTILDLLDLASSKDPILRVRPSGEDPPRRALSIAPEGSDQIETKARDSTDQIETKAQDSKDQVKNIVSKARDAGSSILRAWNSWDNPVDRMVFCAAAMATVDRKKRRHVQEVAAILDPYNWHSQTYLSKSSSSLN